MARLPRRSASGRFVTGGGGKRRRSSSSKRRSSPRRRRSTRRRRTFRSNPPAPRMSARGIMRQAVQGAQDAAWIVGGKAVSRALPTMFNLPKDGVLGLGVQLGTAIAAGWAAHAFAGREAGRFVLAGGLTAPIETALVAYRVPFFAPALSPITAAAQVGAYRYPGVGAYVTPQQLQARAGMSGWAGTGYGGASGLGAYVVPGMDGQLNGDY